MHCRAIKVKYYPLLPRPQANTAAGEGQQRKNDIMKPKRESKHQASTMCRSASAPGQTFLLVTLTSVLCVYPEDFFLRKLSSTGVLHATAHCRRIWPSPAFLVLVVANRALHPHHPAMMKQVPHEPAKGHLATLCLQPWMARAHPPAHAAPAAAGLRAGHQSVSLKHGSNSFQVARLHSQHSGAKRIAFFLTTARK